MSNGVMAAFVFASPTLAPHFGQSWIEILEDACSKNEYGLEVIRISAFMPLPAPELQEFDRALKKLGTGYYEEAWIFGDLDHPYLSLLLIERPKRFTTRNCAQSGSPLCASLDRVGVVLA